MTLLAGAASNAALAQVLEAAVSGAAGASATGAVGGAAGFSVALRQVRVGSTTVGAALGYSSGTRGLLAMPGLLQGGSGAVQLDLTLSANESFGPLGNLIFDLTGSARTDALAQGSLTVRGTIGPLAARARVSAFSADAAAFSPVALARDDRPSLGAAGYGAALGVTARFGRNAILDVEPDLHVTAGGVATRLGARLRRLRAFGDNELRAYLHGAWAAGGWTPTAVGPPGLGGAPRWHAAVGAGVLWPRGRAPDIELAAMLGTDGSTVTPGLRVSLAESLQGGVRLAFDGSLEPYRVDVHPLRLAASVDLPVAGNATLGFTAVAAALDATRPTVLLVQTSYMVPVEVR